MLLRPRQAAFRGRARRVRGFGLVVMAAIDEEEVVAGVEVARVFAQGFGQGFDGFCGVTE